eukprot:tig00000718_g3680.t1
MQAFSASSALLPSRRTGPVASSRTEAYGQKLRTRTLLRPRPSRVRFEVIAGIRDVWEEDTERKLSQMRLQEMTYEQRMKWEKIQKRKKNEEWASVKWDQTSIAAGNTNITAGAKKGAIPDVFAGNFLGKDADFVFDYRMAKTKALRNIEGDFYVPKEFEERIVTHIVKNMIMHTLDKVQVPLILGVWGAKGEGKSFGVELVLKKMGVEPVVMSAGELESKNAGEPAALLRRRYIEASNEIFKGKMCVLMINDLDAGIGRLSYNTQYTVNMQTFSGALMNIADNPDNVQLSEYIKEKTKRVPIIITGNDLSTVYAPLLRDGRMDKFYWKPSFEDRVEVAFCMFKEEGLSREDVRELLTRYPGQSTDFIGAIRARMYDDSIMQYIKQVGVSELGKRLVNAKDPLPTFEKPKLGLGEIMAIAEDLAKEKEYVNKIRLVEEYVSDYNPYASKGVGLRMK